MKGSIKFNWKCDNLCEIPKEHEDALKEDAIERIFQLINEGYYRGVLNTTVRYGQDIVPDENEEEGLQYSGFWELSIEN